MDTLVEHPRKEKESQAPRFYEAWGQVQRACLLAPLSLYLEREPQKLAAKPLQKGNIYIPFALW